MNDWKKLLLALFMTLALGLGAVGCERKGPAEKAGEKIDEAVESAGEKIEEGGEAVQDAADG